MTTPQPRSPRQRKEDTLHRLAHDVDAWVATASPDGEPHLVPLSFLWDGTALLISTPVTTPTGRNLVATGRVRVGIGETRDVVLVEGGVTALDVDELTQETGDAFAEHTGFDPRTLTAHYRYFRIVPRRVLAWREAEELKGRELMRDGEWLVD
ncbi:pyridoxamine 5'-phosphate oxidase family protein [Streptomyces sp. 4N509B]|uniref:pyridoxamine 5'-phosphate oxidase family protein n=1 Tax=Streptomyces sp. 4N509B TaxID=3457413 RepID=UPI003FD1BB68